MTDYKEEFEELYKEPGAAPWTFKEPHPALVELISKISPCRVLEVGCGEGYHAIFLASKGFQVTAIDRSPTAIKYGQQHAKDARVKVEFLVLDYKDLGKFEGEFDFIFDWRFFHEIIDESDRKDYVRNIAKLLVKGGKYLSVAFSGDSDYWGTGKLRKAPTEIELYFATLEDMEKLCEPYFQMIETELIHVKNKQIKVTEKPNEEVPAYFVFMKRLS